MMANRLNQLQSEMLLKFMERNPTVAQTTVSVGKRRNETIARLWNEIAEQLNSAGSGPARSADSWKRYWINLKSRIRTRASLRRKEQETSRIDSESEYECNEYEQRVLTLLDKDPELFDQSLKRKAILFRPSPVPQFGPPESPELVPLSPELVPLSPELVPLSPELVPHSPELVPHSPEVPKPFKEDVTPSPQHLRVASPLMHDPCLPTPACATSTHASSPRATLARRRARRSARVIRTNPQRVQRPVRALPEWFEAAQRTRAEAADRHTEMICEAIERAAVRQERALDRLTAVLDSF